MTCAHIHSIESMGLVDGPGIRTVVFLNGCRLRCRYCHNPDMWTAEKDQTMMPEELVRRLIRFKPYYGSDGGVTFSGGEPLLQSDFLREVLPRCGEAGIHTCLDTAGVGCTDPESVLRYTDLILYDIKAYEPDLYQTVTGYPIDETLRFLETAQRMEKPLWIRHVVVPGLTDGETHLRGLAEYIRTLRNVQRVELLPYHTLGVHKYGMLGIPYPLEGVEPMDQAFCREWEDRIGRMLAAATN